ncbi:VOC family protein [Longibaculum muris]|uniref:VOC family protein n=1 Tax=Longibaculum muris TaxID=1796628 RepID=UPI003AB91346
MLKYSGAMFIADSRERTIQFYKEILGLRVTIDFGSNFTLTGGLSFQTRESWSGFIDCDSQDIRYGGKDAEIYFETDDLDGFLEKLNQRDDIEYLHPLKTHDWGQRGIRFYDPDYHIIEVSETLPQVCHRFYEQGKTVEEISQLTMLSEKVVSKMLK